MRPGDDCSTAAQHLTPPAVRWDIAGMASSALHRATLPVSLLALLLLPLVGCHYAAKSSGDGWVILFDGHSTDAWRGYKQPDFPKESWVIDGDALRTNPAHPVDLITREQFDSFELDLEWKV